MSWYSVRRLTLLGCSSLHTIEHQDECAWCLSVYFVSNINSSSLRGCDGSYVQSTGDQYIHRMLPRVSLKKIKTPRSSPVR